MEVLQFIAPDAAAALAQIQRQLGPDAVVLSVRPLPAQGVARFLPGKTRIEVLAGLPDESSTTHFQSPAVNPAAGFQPDTVSHSSKIDSPVSGRWQSIRWMEATGLLPEHAERLQNHVATIHHGNLPASLEAEWAAVSGALKQFWNPAPAFEDGFAVRPHVFIGPAGAGKTTALCKWLTLASLMEERPTRVFRLDGSSANTADYLSIHCEMLSTPVERFWTQPNNRAELVFIDLPGIDANDLQAMNALRIQLATLPNPHIHLVLNAAYETSILLAQRRAFDALQPQDVIFTHLDEDPRRIKLWNFIFDAGAPIRFLSGGQKIPGDFKKAVPELLFPAGSGSAQVSFR